ncbi:carboxypeptidase-like regulatory domain-containing protein [Aquimarina addita]|uniref:Carboxypeptidase-like regulatory domain-containing protein n=1 Tax=Aquimarina addita TaxID=870485 RepID=A0ABP7XAG3_9FLAO
MKTFQFRKKIFFLFACVGFISINYSQQAGLKGSIVDVFTNEYLADVTVTIKGTLIFTNTNDQGEFDFNKNVLPLGEQIAVILKKGYITKQFPITINQGIILDLKTIDLEYDFKQEQLSIGTISLSDNELDEGDATSSYNLSGLLNASRDVFLSAAAFDFSSTFFRPRGIGNEYGKVLINGLEMNKFSNGRPQWSNWGGLNDVQRNQEFSMGIAPNEYTFGALSGTTHINMRASQYRKGGRISYASSNRSYTGRIMGSYSSGVMNNGWAYTIALSRRYGNEGIIEGTLYDANSIFVAIEKKINESHSINISSFYTPNRRGISTAITDEVSALKGSTYNPNWGYFNGKKKNSRIRKIEEPIVMLNHYWNMGEKTNLQTNIGLQTGNISTTRLDNGGTDLITFNDQVSYVGGGGSNDTNPAHPSNLPSYYLRDVNPTALDFQKAYLAEQRFIKDGQLDWNQLIQVNQLNTQQGKNATYIWYQDRNDSNQLHLSSIVNTEITDRIQINGSINYKIMVSENYAEVLDLMGGTGFLDVDGYALNNANLSINELINNAQSDLQNPNRIVGVGDRYEYNYEMTASTLGGFLQAQVKTKKINFFIGGTISQTSYQRNGLFENGYFPGNESFGKGSSLNFADYGAKTGVTFKIDGRNQLDFQTTYFTKAPTIRNAYSNVRQNNNTVSDIVIGDQESEKIQSVDVGYRISSPKLKVRLTGYYTAIEDATDIGFFYTNALSGSFVQETLTNIGKEHIGGELGISYQITPTIKLKAAAALGQFTYTNDPDLTLTSTSESFTVFDERDNAVKPSPRPLGKALLKNYHVAGGPERAAQLGVEYRDPDFWWVGITSNYFSNAYIDISPLKRTENFSIDPENGIPFNDYDPIIARELLKQEQFDEYMLVNLIGGKSWRVKKYYVGFFATVNNVFDTLYKTGGFEQARNVDYRSALEESNRTVPVYGSRYFYGNRTSYYLNIYVRF